MSSSQQGDVLLVGPDPSGNLGDALAGVGLEVRTAAGVEAASRALDESAVDCAVTAWELPDGTGADLSAAVGAVDEGIRVVAHTDGALGAVATEAAAAGVRTTLPLEEGGDGVPAVVAAVERAVRDRRAVAELARDGEMLTSLLEQVPLSIYFKDRQARIQRASRHLTENDPEEYIRNQEGKVHVHPEDVVGKTDFDLFAPAFAERTVADDRRVMETGEAIVDKIEAGTTASGETQYTSTTKAPRYDEDGDVVGLVGVTLDVTDRETHKRELERQNDRLEEFAEVLTHDVRNPLNVARGYLDLVEADHDADHLAECDAALDRVERLVEEIRAFVVLGRTVEDPEPVELAAVARLAWESVETADAAFQVETDLVLRADRDRLRRALENLFRNAVEHGSASPASDRRDAGEHGSPSPASRARQDADGAGSVEPSVADAAEDAVEDGSASRDAAGITVTVGDLDDRRGFYVADDGSGIPADEREQVFERGYTTSADGTGFGLAIVADIAEAHDWSIAAAESAAGGARIEVTGVVDADPSVGRLLR